MTNIIMIKLLIMDVDGTLTNGQINIGQNGEVFKSFYCRDGLAIIKAAKAGIQPVILTSRISNIVKERAKELGIDIVLQGAQNEKKKILISYLKELEVECKDIAYIGDDINDLECMKICGIVGCPADAVDEVKAISDFISIKNGGYGAVREFIDWIMKLPKEDDL